MRPARTLLTLVLTAASALSLPALAHADTELWSSDGPATPIAAGYQHLAFSSFDSSTGRYALMIGDRAVTPIAIRKASVKTSRRPFDVSISKLGRTPVVLYSRCANGLRACDIYRYPLAGGRETKVRSVSTRSRDEAYPTLSSIGQLAFVRRATRRVSTGFTSRASTARVQCDQVYVGRAQGRAAARRLDLPLCGEISALVVGQGRAVAIVNGDPKLNPSATVVALRLNGGLAKIRARASAAASGFSPFLALAFSGSSVIASQVGSRSDLLSGFVRFPVPVGRATSTPSASIVGPFAIDGDETFSFRGIPGPTASQATPVARCGSGSDTPCRLVQSTGLPTG